MSDKSEPRWLKPVVDYGPLAVFFISYKYSDDLVMATKVIMAATGIVILLSLIVVRKVPVMPLVTAVIIGIFGGLTIYLQDETFIKMKPTIIQTAFAIALSVGLLLKRIWLKALFKSIHMPDSAWRILTGRFICFFLASAILNEIIWRTQPTDIWVSFKVFGLLGFTLVFVVTQLPFINKHTDTEHKK